MAGGWRIGLQEGKNLNNIGKEGLWGDRREMELIIKTFMKNSFLLLLLVLSVTSVICKYQAT